MDHYPPEMGDSIRAMKTHVPLGRLGTESEVSAAIVFLLSEAASFVTGATLRVDGAVPNNKVGYRLPPNDNPTPAYDGFHRAVIPKVLRKD
jgi:citronellol/citronellal dehydrogenase